MADMIEREYLAEVQQVMSGDDLYLMVDLGVDGLHKKVRARLKGVDTPDAYRAKPDSKAGNIRSDVAKLVEGKTCRIVTTVGRPNTASWPIVLFFSTPEGEINLNDMLIAQGYIYHKKV